MRAPSSMRLQCEPRWRSRRFFQFCREPPRLFALPSDSCICQPEHDGPGHRAPALRRPRSLELSIDSGRLSSMESVEHKEERLEPLFFGFIGKDATLHRRPYTSRTPGHSTPNAGRNGRHQRRSIPGNRCSLEHRGTRRCRLASHRAPRRRPGLQLANESDRAVASTIPSFDIALLHKNLKQKHRRQA